LRGRSGETRVGRERERGRELASRTHGSATTTPSVREAIQASEEKNTVLAKRYGADRKTIAKWKAREFTSDKRMGPKNPRSSLLTYKDEAIIIAYRIHPLGDFEDHPAQGSEADAPEKHDGGHGVPQLMKHPGEQRRALSRFACDHQLTALAFVAAIDDPAIIARRNQHRCGSGAAPSDSLA
jgi:hypothetical protein